MFVFEIALLSTAALCMLGVLGLFIRHLWRHPRLLLKPFQPRPRNVIAFLIALWFACFQVGRAWTIDGYFSCDFAGQWLMGRMLLNGDASRLYLVPAGQEALATGFKGDPSKWNTPGYEGDQLQTMVRDILLKGNRVRVDGIEGPLYPPTMMFFMAPFAILPPQAAHAVIIFMYAIFGFVTAWLLTMATHRRLQFGEAALLLFAFPNFADALVLGQNSPFTLILVAAGWTLWSRGWHLTGGLLWGLLVYKPVFAIALAWVPLFLFSWRMFIGMGLVGGFLSLLTLPFCGMDAWQRWFWVGTNSARIYSYDINWIWMSRDLLGIPRRLMWTADDFWEQLKLTVHIEPFNRELHQRVQPGALETIFGVNMEASVIGWSIWGTVLGLTVLITAVSLFRHWQKGLPAWPTPYGPRPAFLLFGALLTVYHFMHYDLLPMAVPAILFLASADQFRRRGRILIGVWFAIIMGCAWELSLDQGILRMPLETYLMLIAWGWTGWLTLTEPLEHRSLGVARAYEMSIASSREPAFRAESRL